MLKQGWDRAVHCPHCGKCFTHSFIINAKQDAVYLKVCREETVSKTNNWLIYCMYCGSELRPTFGYETSLEELECENLPQCVSKRKNKEAEIESLKTGKSIQQVKNERLLKEIKLQKELEEVAREELEEKRSRNSSTIQCPNCSSERVEKISGTSRFIGAAVWGIFSSNIGKTYKCKSCGYKW